ncbi:MAG TPA: hypothetical protein VGE07_23860 [Herpetosiphonaceae bacterium]
MRGKLYTTDSQLADDDLQELGDELAMKLYATMGPKVYLLGRTDISQLIDRYIDDLDPKDQEALPWLIWDLFQEGMELEFG